MYAMIGVIKYRHGSHLSRGNRTCELGSPLDRTQMPQSSAEVPTMLDPKNLPMTN